MFFLLPAADVRWYTVPMIYYESPRMRIRWDEEIEAAIAEGEGYIDGEELRAGMEAGLELLVSKKSSKWIADMRFRRAIPEADALWIAQDWTPRSVEAGLRHAAIVVPSSVLGKMGLKSVVQKMGPKSYEFKYFDSVEEARAWLASK